MHDRSFNAVAVDAPVRSLLAEDPDLAGLVKDYVASMPAKRTSLRSLLQRQDLSRLKTEAHQLAGSAGSHGFPEMSQLAIAVEAACNLADAEAAALATIELLAHIARVSG